jgi:hypothetical protein
MHGKKNFLHNWSLEEAAVFAHILVMKSWLTVVAGEGGLVEK